MLEFCAPLVSELQLTLLPTTELQWLPERRFVDCPATSRSQVSLTIASALEGLELWVLQMDKSKEHL